MTTPEEVLGLVKGLADVVYTQQKAQHDALDESNKQINNLANSVKIIAETKQHGPFGLKLPQLNLPKYHGRPEEDLERFIEQFRSTLESSNTHWRYYLKQQVAEELRAYDAIVLAEKDHSSLVSDPEKTTDVEYRLFFDNFCGRSTFKTW